MSENTGQPEGPEGAEQQEGQENYASALLAAGVNNDPEALFYILSDFDNDELAILLDGLRHLAAGTMAMIVTRSSAQAKASAN